MKKITLNPDDFVEQFRSGESVLSISKRLGVSRAVINRNLIEHGIQPRGQREAGLLNWAKMPPDERKQQVEAAHLAAAGRVAGFDELVKRAKIRERNLTSVSEKEIKFAQLMKDAGIRFKQQTAIGPYNCDFTIGSVAVEIFGGNWHWYGNHLAKTNERFRYILNSGFHILVISDYAGSDINADSLNYLRSYLDFTSANPAMTREYRVIRGAGDLIACGSIYDKEISIIPSFTAGRDSKGRYVTMPR